MPKGQAFEPKLTDMTDILTQLQGNISKVADYYKVSREAIYQFIHRNPDLKGVVKELRNVKDENILDAAEGVIAHCLNLKKDNPKLAFDAARYVLDNKGKARDWGNTKEESDVRGLVQDRISQEITVLYETQVKGKK